jgi:DNA-binding transcriptional MerR regulator
MKPEFTIEQIIAFVDKGYTSVAARYAKSAMQHYDELLQQRDELLEALKELMEGVRGLPPLTAIAGILTKQYEKAQRAITKAEERCQR